MAHKKKQTRKEKWGEAEDDAHRFLYGLTESVRQWFIHMLIYTVVFIIISIAIYQYVSWAGELLAVIPICTSIFLAHELLHYIITIQLGYKTEWYSINIVKIPYTQKNITMEGFDVIFPNKEAMEKHRWRIGMAPYVIIFPLSFLFLFTPYIFLQISGVILIISHVWCLPYEAKKV